MIEKSKKCSSIIDTLIPFVIYEYGTYDEDGVARDEVAREFTSWPEERALLL